MTERLPFHFSLSCIGEGNGNPLQCSCLENPRDGWAWWAAVYGVAQSQTRLKGLSSSRSSRLVLEVESEITRSWGMYDLKLLNAYCRITFYKTCTNLHFCQWDIKCLSVYIWQHWTIFLFLIGTTFDRTPVHFFLANKNYFWQKQKWRLQYYEQ